MTEAERVAWVDIAKGISIVLIVTLHATLGVEKVAGVEGYMNDVVDFAKPFRAPTFFLLAGLFLSRTIDRDWRSFLDAKVVHFAYFYVLWLAIQAACKSPNLASGELSFLELAGLKSPAGTLWYIYMLPVFFVTTRLLRRVPPPVCWPAPCCSRCRRSRLRSSSCRNSWAATCSSWRAISAQARSSPSRRPPPVGRCLRLRCSEHGRSRTGWRWNTA